jgi:hypothetical protein
MIAKVTTAETTSEPKQPMRLLKNKNMGNAYPVWSSLLLPIVRSAVQV